MIRKTQVFILLLIFSLADCFAQQLSNQVMVSAAGVTKAGVISYSQSIGEPVVEIVSGGGFFLTQGFQQPHLEKQDIPIPPGTGVNVYPNPAYDYIYVHLWGEVPRKFNVELINLMGVILASWKLEFSSQYNYEMPVEGGKLKAGIYLVRVVSTDKIISRVFKIEKL